MVSVSPFPPQIIASVLLISQVQATFFPFSWQPPRPSITYNLIAGGQRRPYPTGNTYRVRTIPSSAFRGQPPPLQPYGPSAFRGQPPPFQPYGPRPGYSGPPRPPSNPFGYDVGDPYSFPRPNSLDPYYGALPYDNEPFGLSIPNYIFRSPYAFPPYEQEGSPFLRAPHPEARSPLPVHPAFAVRSPPIDPPSIFIRPPHVPAPPLEPGF